MPTGPFKPLFCLAHRGGRNQGIENALNTIQASLDLGADGIEIDVWLVNSTLLVTHDRRLGRVIQGEGRLLDLPESKIPSLHLYNGTAVATLDEVLALVDTKAVLNIELKGPGCAEAVVATIKNHCTNTECDLNQYVVSSFDHHQLLWIKDHAPEIKRGVLVGSIPLDYAACCKALGAFSFHPTIDFISPALVEDARNRGLEVWVYTVNDEDDFKDLSAMGVTGVFTDFPDRLIEWNQRFREM